MRRFLLARSLVVEGPAGDVRSWLAESYAQRVVGLAALPAIPAGHGLLIPRCSAVHTWGMRFRLDIAFIEWPPQDRCSVFALRQGVAPRRCVRLHRRSARGIAVLEAPEGTLAPIGFAPGAGLRLRECGGRPGPASAAVTFNPMSGLEQEQFLSERNVALLRAAYESIGREGLDDLAAWDLISTEVVIRDRPEAPDPQTYKGWEGVRQALATSDESFEEFTMAPVDLIAVGDRHVVVVLKMSGRGRESGVPVTEEIAHLWTIEDGKAVAMQVYSDAQDALRDAHSAASDL
jgi:ketosteroid isomerase-like protein/uncharacterized membrane protein (UPF0127 family)